jgi:hypothetical protein
MPTCPSAPHKSSGVKAGAGQVREKQLWRHKMNNDYDGALIIVLFAGFIFTVVCIGILKMDVDKNIKDLTKIQRQVRVVSKNNATDIKDLITHQDCYECHEWRDRQ